MRSIKSAAENEMALFEVKDIDRKVFEDELAEFLPDSFIDIHTHVHSVKHRKEKNTDRQVLWPALVASENTGEQLAETYRLLFPGKTVNHLSFCNANTAEDYTIKNEYVAAEAKKYGFYALYFSMPRESREKLERQCKKGSFLGLKSYLSFAEGNIPEKDIEIFDFFPHHQLEAANRNGWIVMLHIPRHGRLGDPVNIRQLREIDERYPNAKIIIAHIGRAYADIDAGNAFTELSHTKNLLFDFSANTNENIMYKTLETFGPNRLLFGSDLPITRMRTRRIIRNNTYINLVPKGLYGDMTGVPHMEEVSGGEAGKLTFFLYEELVSFKRAAEKAGLKKDDVKAIMFENAKKIISGVKNG
jgi:predicted TIM-barrel fold metal-dependent hydrolase